MSVEISEIVLIGVGLFLITKSQEKKSPAAQVINDFTQSGDWFQDQWARLHGLDLAINGQNPSPSGLDAYGMRNENMWPGQTPNIGRVQGW